MFLLVGRSQVITFNMKTCFFRSNVLIKYRSSFK